MSLLSNNINFRGDGDTAREINDIANAFAPITKNRSETIRMAIKICRALLVEPQKLNDLIERLRHVLQALEGTTAVRAKATKRLGRPRL